MKVRELQEKLSKLDPELEVLAITEDEALLAKGQGFWLLYVEAVTPTEGQMRRGDDGVPSLIIGKTPTSATFVLLEVTSDF